MYKYIKANDSTPNFEEVLEMYNKGNFPDHNFLTPFNKENQIIREGEYKEMYVICDNFRDISKGYRYYTKDMNMIKAYNEAIRKALNTCSHKYYKAGAYYTNSKVYFHKKIKGEICKKCNIERWIINSYNKEGN